MVYKFELYLNDTWNDVSAYVQTNAFLGDRIDQTFNLSKFIISHIKADKIVGIDFSKPIKPWTPVRITVDSDVFRFFASDTTRTMIRKTNPKLYKHEINVVEATKILQRKPVADSTVTQPKSQQFTSLYESNQKSDSITVRNTQVTPSLNIVNQSTDITKVDGNTLKANNDGQALVTFEIRNYQYNEPFILKHKLKQAYKKTDAEVELRCEVYIDGIKVEDEDFFIPATGAGYTGPWYDITDNIVVDTPQPIIRSLYVPIPQAVTDQVVTVKLQTLGNWQWTSYTNPLPPSETYEDKVDVITYLSIGAKTTTSDDYIYLKDYVEDVIYSMNVKDDNDPTTMYSLDSTTAASIANILCPEFTHETSTAWDKIEKAANVVNAVPEIKEDYKTITFRYLDEISDIYYDQDKFEDETLSYTMDTYISGLESNTSNLVEEDVLLNAKIFPYEGGWATVRTADELVGKVTDDSGIFPTKGEVQKVYQLAVKGPSVKIDDGGVSKTLYGNLTTEELTKWGISDNESVDSFWHIGDRVVNKSEWDILDNWTHNENDSARRTYRTRGNHIYYSQGSENISGLGHKTETVTDIIGSTVAPRALMETIMASCAVYIGDVDNGYSNAEIIAATNTYPEKAITLDHNLYEGVKYRVYYVALNKSRGRSYKHNTYDLDADIVDFINEQDKLNDTDNLGKYINTTLNRQGDLDYSVSGKALTYDSIPKLGYRTYDDLVVTSRDLNLNKNMINYTLTLSKDFINRSTYLSRNSAFRSWEISNNDTVDRQDIYNEFIVLTKDADKLDVVSTDYTILTPYAKQMLIQNFCELAGGNENPISYAKTDVYKEAQTITPDTYDMTVNPFSLGTTINLQLGFETNFSAGAQIKDVTINSEPSKLSEFKQYTSQFGRVHKISTTLYPRGKEDNSEADANLWPEYSQASTDNALMTFERTINKDNRERYVLNIQFPHIPHKTSEIKVYPGLAKYSALIREKGNIDVGIALLESGYKPTVNTTKLNKNRTTLTTSNAAAVYDATNVIYGIRHDNVSIPAGNRYEGYVIYEKNTEEMIYAVIEDIAVGGVDWLYNTDTIWFIPRSHLKDNTRPTE